MGQELARETNLVIAFVDVTSQEVLDVVRMDIGSADRDGARGIVMHNATGRTVKLLATSSGDGISPICSTEVVPTETTQTCTGQWLCWLVGWIAYTLQCTAIGVSTALVGGVICAFVCEAVFNWVCGHACN